MRNRIEELEKKIEYNLNQAVLYETLAHNRLSQQFADLAAHYLWEAESAEIELDWLRGKIS